jgi:hypothetical protein
MPVLERKSLKGQFLESLYLRKLANPLRPELYLLGAAIALLVWLFRPLERFFFHWPMFFGIGVTGLIARSIERQKRVRAPTRPESLIQPAPPLILQLLQDFTSCIFLALPLTLAAAIASQTMDLMISLVLEVLFPLLNFRFVTSLSSWLVYRLAYRR